MSRGMKLPNSSNKTLLIAGALVLIFVIGLAISLNGRGDQTATENVSAKEAAEAKKKGIELYKQGKWDGALESLKKAVAGNPSDVYARFQLAYAYEQNNLLDDAYEQYAEVLKIDKSSADAHYNAGRILVKKNELDKAIAEFETAAKLDTDFTGVRADLAKAYVQKEEYEKALATYAELEKVIGSDKLYLSRIHSAKGAIYKEMGQTRKAKAEFAKALELDKNNTEATEGLK